MIQYKQGLVLTGKGRKRRWRKRDSAMTVSAGILGGGGAYLARREQMRNKIYSTDKVRRQAAIDAADAHRLKSIAEQTIARKNAKIAAAIQSPAKVKGLNTPKQIAKELADLHLQATKVAQQSQRLLEKTALEKELAGDIQKVIKHPISPKVAGGIGAGVAVVGTIGALNYLHNRRIRKAARDAEI